MKFKVCPFNSQDFNSDSIWKAILQFLFLRFNGVYSFFALISKGLRYMPEKSGDRTIFTLSEVCRSIKKTLEERYKSRFWVRAELMKLNYYKYSGHAYPDLVQKDDGRIIAQIRGVIWKSDLLKIQASFMREINQPLTEGIEILFEAGIVYDAVHGISLRIYQIDTSFHLGLIEKEKFQTIERLKAERIFDSNKLRVLRDLPKNIAVISVETSKGWADFRQVVEPYVHHYGLFFMMFPALLQGDGAVASIRGQLQKIQLVKSDFDAVMIIRGGGGEASLTCFNNFELCRDICTFPLPVFTGIGHSTNLTVAEMIAYHHSITPTALGEFYIDIFKTRESELVMTVESISKQVALALNRFKTTLAQKISQISTDSKKQIKNKSERLSNMVENIMKSSARIMIFHFGKLIDLTQSLRVQSMDFFKQKHKELQAITRIILIQNPENILKKGFVYLLKDGNHLSSVDNIAPNQSIQIIFRDGRAHAEITSIEKVNINEKEKNI